MACHIVRPVLIGLVTLLAAVPAAAQGPLPANLAVALATVTDPHGDIAMAPGWSVAGALRFREAISFVLDAGGSYASLEDGNVRTHTVLGGLRLARERDARWRPFAQLLAGAECYCGTTATLGSLFRGFSLQPGVGVDWRLTPRFAVRVQSDVRRTMGADDGLTRFRLATGVVVGFSPRIAILSAR